MLTQPAKPHPSSFRAKRGICFFFSFCALLAVKGNAEPKRPKITRVAGATILVSDLPESREVYRHLLLLGSCDWCEDVPTSSFDLSTGQVISLQSAPSPTPDDLLDEVFLQTSDLKAMKKYLASQKVKFESLAAGKTPLRLRVTDPDGHHVSLVQEMTDPLQQSLASAREPSSTRLRLIHAGFIVRDRAAMEHFYKDILGFRPYWHGGMKDDQTDWVSLQVPDGTDWVEFMVNVPENADQRLRGIMNHIALGVPDIQQAREQLLKNGVHLTEEPKLGRDGKWQLNLYDPDQTRIEFMEFTPKEKPCCSEFTGPHPKP
jgi:catechol 2,3-dioxygenase-like lactoylglutathione lyase family enzyme